MKYFSLNTIRTPRSIDTVIRIASNELPAQQAGMTNKQVESIWQAAQHLYRNGNHPMLSLCIRRQGQIVLNRSIGHAQGNGLHDALDNTKVIATPDTPVCLFSASKAITAVLIHILHERGLIDLNDPVVKYIPEYGVEGKHATTILQLLNHRGGIPRLTQSLSPELMFDRAEVVRLLCAATPIYPAGQRQAYHAVSAGYILGELIERVTSQTASQFLQENIAKPMDMPYFDYGLAPQYRHLVATNSPTGVHAGLGTNQFFNRALGGNLDQIIEITNHPRFMDVISPAANIFTSAEQASRFFDMLLHGGVYQGKRIIQAETIRNAIMPQSGMSFDHTLWAPMRYSSGFMLGANPIGMYGSQTGQAFGHLGLSNIFCWADPMRDISVSLLNTGKSIVGTHLPALVRLLLSISHHCPRVS
ncbi:MAG: class A beta-lactamase-related serine hydrolase [Moraxellaceae bacterium]|nr:MAG: class A beta-lactamase-related serine hydrolase [Moraxellaceae bacterium]